MPRARPVAASRLLAALLTLAAGAATTVASEPLARERMERARARYATPESWAERRAELRRAFLEAAHLWPLPERGPVRAIVGERREHDGYSVENVALETLPGFYCTGNLYRPLELDRPGPAVLCPHGHFRPLGRFREEHQVRCAQLARMGATVFSYGMVGWNDSRQTTHDDPLVLALQTWNSLRALDYVAALDGVDPERIGVTGASGGGTQSTYLALVDDRVKAVAPVVILYPWTEEDGCRCEGGLPVMTAAETCSIELAAAAAPRAQLVLSAGDDPTRHFPEVGFPFLRDRYALAGAPDAVRNVHLADEAHDFGPSKRRAVYAFFSEHLGLPEGPEDLGRIAIEPPEALEVFNDARPLPPGAIHGSEAVAGALARVVGAGGAASDEARPPLDGPLAEYAVRDATPDDEALIFTPPGFDKVGVPAEADGPDAARLSLTFLDGSTGRPTPCRVNVVGPDGNYYEPASGPLKIHSLTGVWPNWPKGWGNRPGKAPFRYFGRFFYSTGEAVVTVPAGKVRVEVWKGFEYRPETRELELEPGEARNLTLTLDHDAPMPELGYYSGDTHVHIPRADDADDRTIFDLMAAEDIRVAALLAYNEPAGPYLGEMDDMDSPQRRGLGEASARERDGYRIVSGQEYRSGTYGHLNLFLLDDLVLRGQSLDADRWPLYGDVIREARAAGGVAIYAHGGYAQAIYADVVQGHLDAVELLQFGVYRGIGLIDWYRLLNAGFRLPAVGASDYPACRKLGDCLTYVHAEGDGTPDVSTWLRGAAAGRSFVTTGPLVLLEVEGRRPGDAIERTGPGPHRVNVRLRVRSEVAPVSSVQLVVNGRVLETFAVPEGGRLGRWIELERPVVLDRSSWVAARASSTAANGQPDAEAHTNPVYVVLDGKAPYEKAAVDALIRRIDDQIAAHKARSFPEQARVIAYFERSRDILLTLRDAGGAPATGHPSDLARDDAAALDTGRRTHTEEELRAFLRPVPPRPVAEAVAGFEAVGGFRLEPVAHEPLVVDPVAAAFDEDGSLYVAEMRDYPYKPAPGGTPLGTVRKLVDRDGDGTFDESVVFADGLLWAAGVAPWKGGVFVTAPPDILYLKDTDGDGRADVRRVVYTGFGTDNQQAMLNNLQWGLDHKVYGSTAGNGGRVRPADRPDAEAVDVGGRDFRFDPAAGTFEPITGTVQFGTTFDDWGNRFLCSESRPLLHAVLPLRYLARNPYLPAPGGLHDLAPGAVPIFRISPIERWRQIRSSRRIAHNARPATAAGASHHVVDAAAGVTIYRGGAYPPEFYGDAFVGDSQNNLIHRRVLEPDGVTFTSRRADEATEFVRSPDTWFRPVNLVNAPDGTLYVLDMSREVIESIHIPTDVVKHLDLTSGRDRGRIYRIAPPGFRYPGPPRLGSASTAELVAALESPHGWWRDTAHRLLHERRDPAAVAPLRRLLRSDARPESRLLALWSLHGLDALGDDDLAHALGDASPHVRRHAVELSEPRLDDSPPILARVLALEPDADPRVRLQLAFSLGASRDPRAAAALARIARVADDPWTRAAVLSSVGDNAPALLAGLLDGSSPAPAVEPGSVPVALASVLGARRDPDEIGRAIAAIASAPALSDADRDRLVASLGAALARSGSRLDELVRGPEASRRFLEARRAELRRVAADASAPIPDRVAAVRFLAGLSFAAARATLATLLDVRQPEPVQVAALDALAGYPEPEVAPLVLARWREATPTVRASILELLLGRDDRVAALLRAIDDGAADAASLAPAQRARLLDHRDPSINSLARRVLGASSSSREEVVAAYRPALERPGDPTRGESVFLRECAACHRIGSHGHAVGPDVTSSASRDPEALLVHILDPGRYVAPNFVQYQVADTSGRVYSGLLASQSPTSLTLRREEGKEDTILRADVEELTSAGTSLMPEGLESKIPPAEMADLLAYLLAAQSSSTPESAPPLDVGTEPGLIEPPSP